MIIEIEHFFIGQLEILSCEISIETIWVIFIGLFVSDFSYSLAYFNLSPFSDICSTNKFSQQVQILLLFFDSVNFHLNFTMLLNFNSHSWWDMILDWIKSDQFGKNYTL